MEFLQFVTIDVWTMLFTWANLIILFLLLKKFLFKPVNKVLDARAEEIENTYKSAENTEHEALSMKSEYEQRLQNAKTEADSIIQSAVEAAERRSEGIVSEADTEAKRIMEKSQKQIEQDKRNAVNEAREDIASMAVDVAQKLIGKKFDGEDDEKLISDIIDRI